VDGAGNVHVAWEEWTVTDSEIFFKLRNATSGTWTTTEVVSSGCPGASYEPSLAADGAGNAHVAWIDDSNYDYYGPRDIFYNTRNATTCIWGTTQIVPTEGIYQSQYPSLVVDGDGNAHVAWVDYSYNGYLGMGWDIFCKRQAANLSPVIASPADLNLIHGSTDNIIRWIITDASTGTSNYTILDSGGSIVSGKWSSGVPVSFNVDGLAIGTHNLTIIADDGYGDSAQDIVIVTVEANYTPVVVGIVIGTISVIGVITQRFKYKVIVGRVRSMRESAGARRQFPGKIKEVVYSRAKDKTLVQTPVVKHASPTNLAAVFCPSCGEQVPKGFENARFCVYCGKAFQGVPG
jgi:hypothetical protein